MSPKEAKVFLAEDNEDYANTLKNFLEMAGHKVIVWANTLSGALDAIRDLPEDGVEVGLVDGNLSRWEDSGQDGQKVANEFRKKFPKATVLGISSDKQPWSDDPESSKRMGATKIVNLISKVIYPKPQ